MALLYEKSPGLISILDWISFSFSIYLFEELIIQISLIIMNCISQGSPHFVVIESITKIVKMSSVQFEIINLSCHRELIFYKPNNLML